MSLKSRLARWGAALSTALLLVAGTAGQANAVLLLDAGGSSSLQSFIGGNYAAGSEFTTGSALTIRSLGWLDAEGDGLLGNHMVGLWSTASQTLLASVTITPTSATVLSAHGTAQWFLEDITPLLIGPGSYRIAGLLGPNSHNALSDDKIGNGVTISSGYVRTSFPNGGFAFPNLSFSSQAIRATASTDSVGQPIPEPAALTLFGLGLVGLGTLRRRRRATA